MDFKAVKIEDKNLIQSYMYQYGEGSCQHSFVSMFCMADKYGDAFFEKDGWLYVQRTKRNTDTERVYLFPMGNTANEAKLRFALQAIIDDAHKHGATVRFDTLTAAAMNAVQRLFPGQFLVTPLRDYSEYIYTNEKLAELPGSEMANKRHDLNTFFRTYGDNVRIERITEQLIEPIREFQKMWIENRLNGDEDVQLEHENIAIQLGLSHFTELGLSGIVIYIDGVLSGYAYGAPLSEDCYDVIIEKGDRRIADIYRVLNRDLVRMCCKEYRYINREEDVGVAGLRQAKLSYKPDVMLDKYLLTEVKHE